MRSIFFLILASNIIFFAQQYFFSVDLHEDIKNKGEAVDSDYRALHLLSEKPDVVLNKKTTVQNHVVADDEIEKATRKTELCSIIGPYDQLLQAEYAVEHLSALGVKAHIAPLEIKEGDLFWVYLNPEVSEREALNRLYELQGKQIESHVISKGELMNGISLGRFSLYEDAETHAKHIKSIGYDAQIKIMPRMIQETWVVLSADSAEKIDGSVWAMLVEKQKGLERRKNYCFGVASQ
ncbi:hypothetical protein [Cellvibrio fontiphilus]|uniref:SPOR domain-containing protein n=1 Tax=Cellvibrio fontiphilus TaxID=1815559 RepID=A0ABV7FBL2_9GAMM